MGLAPYGEPSYADLILEKLIDLKDDGSFRMDMSYFNYCQGLTMTSREVRRAVRRPAAPARSRRSTQREMDLAASIQAVTEEIMLRMARHVHARDGIEEPLPGRRRGAQLRRQRPDPARRAVREHLDPAGGRRRGRRARRRAVHLAPAARQPAHAAARATASTARCSGPRFTRRRDRDVPRLDGREVPTLSTTTTRCATHVAELIGRREGRRLVPGADGVRPARARRPQHPRRRPQRGRCSR